MLRMPLAALSFSLTLGFVPSALAQTTYIVDELGDDGWTRGDTRLDGNVTFETVAGRGALVLTTGFPSSAGTDKATLDKRGAPFCVPNGVDCAGVGLFDANLSFEYQWYRTSDATPTVATAALKLGVDTSLANASGNSYEAGFDLIFVYEPYNQNKITQTGVWCEATTTEKITPTSGRFWVVNLSGTTTLPYGHLNASLNAGGVARQADLQTLATWAERFKAHPTVTSPTIVSVQLGIGSANPDLVAAVDYLTFSATGVGLTRWEFAETTDNITTTTAPPDGTALIDGSLDTLSLPFVGTSGVDPNKVEAIAPADVEGDTLEAKRATLDTIADEIDAAKVKAAKQPGAAAVRLRRVLEFILGDATDPSDDLIVGEIGDAIRGLVGEARRALKPGN